MCGSNSRSHFYHGSEVSLTSGRPMVLGAKRCVAQKRWGQRNAEKDRHQFVCLFVSLLGGGVLTPYLFFLQIDTWEEK